jgi:hypothetical protein
VNACASLGPIKRTGILNDPKPVVLVDGIPEPRLTVESYSVKGPMDTRSARLSLDLPDNVPGLLPRWLCAQVVIAWPMRLVDDQIAWPVLMHGVLKLVASSESAGEKGLWFDLLDNWDALTSKPVDTIWWLNTDGTLIQKPQGVLSIGADKNRSASKFDIDGQQAHVLELGSGLAWTVRSALETISAPAGLSLSLQGLSRELANAPLLKQIDLTEPLAKSLVSVLDPYGLVIQRDISLAGTSVIERRAVRPISLGRPIRVAWTSKDQPLGDVLKTKTNRPAQAAREWIARADGWLIESTFDLVRGWDAALEGLADDEYDKANSSDFTTYADVYRRWVLNEDGFFTNPPYNSGAGFDLAAFFGDAMVNPQPLAFESNLALQDDGTAFKPIIEMSTNGGAGWSIFPSKSLILDARVGVYLDAQALPSAFLAAAKSGQARIRVTATIRSPVPIEISRWKGNAFTGKLPSKVFDLSDVFRFQRIDSASIHYADVQAGNLQADELDQTNPMLDWLIDQLSLNEQGGASGEGKATLDLTGFWPMLRPGDRVLEARGGGVAANGEAQAITRSNAHIRSIDARLKTPRRGGRTTRLELTF